MDAQLPHTRGNGDFESRLCSCGNKMSSKDTHQVCSCCLGLEHARMAFEAPGSCRHCACFTVKSLRRRLVRQASLSGQDPYMPASDVHNEAVEAEGAVAVGAPCASASASWGSQLDLAAAAPPLDDVLELDYGDDDEDASELLISEEDEDEDDSLIPSAQAAKPEAVNVSGDC